jgi:rSAM/selenodomain-associated transferase 2
MKFPPGNGRTLARIGAFVVSVLTLAVIFRRIELATFWTAIAGMKPIWFAASCGIFGVALLAAAGRWHLVLRSNGAAVHIGTTVKTVLAGHLFNTFLFGPAGGDIAKAALYGRWHRFPVPTVLASCFLDRLLGGSGFVLLVVRTPVLALLSGHVIPWRPDLLSRERIFVIAGVTVLISGLAIARHRRSRIPAAMQQLAKTFASGARQLLKQRALTLQGVALAFLAHVCTNGLLLLSLIAVTRHEIVVANLLWTFPVISLISAAPLTFAGTGLREGAALVLLGLYQIPAEDAVAASLLVLLNYLIWAAFAAVLLAQTERKFRKSLTRQAPETISVVIPTRNEELALPATVQYARANSQVTEIIVVDGGSSDKTVEIARSLGCKIVQTAPGRGGQMRAGAAIATGDVVILLHADTWLPPNAGISILNCLRDRTVVAGGFWKTFRERNWLMAGSRFRCLLRIVLTRRVMGDQALFVRRSVLAQIGGVPDMPLMEEFELCRRLRRCGRIALACATVSTSARRFIRYGVLRTYWRMLSVTVRYQLGVPTHKLARTYERD